jgi:hypothetical protein
VRDLPYQFIIYYDHTPYARKVYHFAVLLIEVFIHQTSQTNLFRALDSRVSDNKI